MTGIVNMPKDDVETFRIFDQWLYTAKLDVDLSRADDENDETLFEDLIKVILFADKIRAPRVHDAAMDAFNDASLQKSSLWRDDIELILENTTSTAPIRRFVVEAFALESDWSKLLPKHIEASPPEFLCEAVRVLWNAARAGRTLGEGVVSGNRCAYHDHSMGPCEPNA